MATLSISLRKWLSLLGLGRQIQAPAAGSGDPPAVRWSWKVWGLRAIPVLCLLALGLAGCAGRESGPSGGLGVGQPAPDFTLESLSGDQVSLSDFRGQVVLLNLWATWCPSCKTEIPVLEAAYQAHKQDGLVVLGIDVGESAAAVQPFVAQAGMTYPVLLDGERSLLGKYRALGLPVSIVIDGNGLVRARSSGELSRAGLEDLLDGLLPLP
jgi:peroxiredoxin